MSGRRLPAGALWVIGLGATAAVLHWAGRAGLEAPPLDEPTEWAAWLERRDPIVTGFSLLRVVALGAVWYVVIATLVGAVLRVLGAASLVRVADRLTVAPVRRMLAGSMSLGLAASGVIAVAAPALRAPVAAVAQAGPSSTTSTTTTLTTTPSTSIAATSTTRSTTGAPPATVTMHRLGPADLVQPPAAPTAPEIATATAATGERWTVKPGECFWSIADSVLTNRWGRPATDAEIVPYWQRLIDVNRHELVQRDDPHLILPGQVFAVPAP